MGFLIIDIEVAVIQFVFLKQFFCNHRYRKEPSYRQLRKDDNKVMWICYRCNKHLERDRWNPPEGAVKDQD